MPLRVLVDYMLKGGVLNSVNLQESSVDPFFFPYYNENLAFFDIFRYHNKRQVNING